jgi:hypothetical protein
MIRDTMRVGWHSITGSTSQKSFLLHVLFISHPRPPASIANLLTIELLHTIMTISYSMPFTSLFSFTILCRTLTIRRALLVLVPIIHSPTSLPSVVTS